MTQLQLTNQELDDIYPPNQVEAKQLISQAKAAIEMSEALEWLAKNDVFLARDEPLNRYVVGKDMKKTGQSFEYILLGEGSTHLEAIQNARMKESE